MDLGSGRMATWECLAPACAPVLRPGPHYPTVAAADAGLRQHLLTEHAALLWESRGETVLGRVIRFHELPVS